MKPTKRYQFTGDRTKRPKKVHPDSPENPEPYIADEELIQAVNLAIYLRRPLLIEGEAGCGKTRLATAVAHELGLPYYRWDIRSTSKAKEGLYEYDALARLHDVQVKQGGVTLNRDPGDPKVYREFGALGKAFNQTEVPAVVLIDEIDKADLDFPNDLLAVLDEPWRFDIPETQEVVEASKSNQPIVIITSNKEKGNLPAPFLRRCVYYFISFPNDENRLKKIVEAHFQAQTDTKPLQNELVEVAAEKFLEVRKMGGLFKNPGTSEFLDWLEALHNFGSKPFQPKQLKTAKLLPYRELLFKLRSDWQKYAATT